MYHIGLIRGTGPVQCWANGHRASTLVVQMRRDVDYLSPGIWKYLGIRDTTKAHVKANKAGLLAALNKQYGTAFTALVVD